jgi:hypothetical protein
MTTEARGDPGLCIQSNVERLPFGAHAAKNMPTQAWSMAPELHGVTYHERFGISRIPKKSLNPAL